MRKRSKKVKSSPFIWDYDPKSIDLSNPKIMKWYLERKISHGDFTDLRKKDIKKFLPKLDIDPYLKQLLGKYFKAHAKA